MKIKSGQDCYDILFTNEREQIEQGLKDWFKRHLACKRVMVVIDDYLAEVQKAEINHLTNFLATLDLKVNMMLIKSVEMNKSIESAERIWTRLAEDQFTRKDVMIALGGGIIGDLTGFCASTYMRGIDFIQMPSTLLAQIDSSIGGKVAVNLTQGKNLVGAFYNPALVLIHSPFLKTLSDGVLSDGVGELIKYAYLGHREILDTLDYFKDLKGFRRALEENEALLNEMMALSLRIKKSLVESDFKETGLRRFLNLGHTMGHAIEKGENYRYSHGHCVANGCLWALRLSGLSEAHMDLRRVMAAYRIPILEELKVSDLMTYLMRDKKSELNGVHFVLPTPMSTDIRKEETPNDRAEKKCNGNRALSELMRAYEHQKLLSEDSFLSELQKSARIQWIAFDELEGILTQLGNT